LLKGAHVPFDRAEAHFKKFGKLGARRSTCSRSSKLFADGVEPVRSIHSSIFPINGDILVTPFGLNAGRMTTNSDQTTTTIHAVLVPGFWLGGWVWDAVAPVLERKGITPHQVTLPGLENPNVARDHLTLDDHIMAVADIVKGLDGDVVLVGHSGGGAVVQGIADRMPERIRRVIYLDTGPLLEGISLSETDTTGDIELPGWEDLADQGNSPEGLDEATRSMFRARAVPHPGGVARSPIHLHDQRRLDVATTVICTSLPSVVLKELADTGQMPTELPLMSAVRYIDLPTGHWPMLSVPEQLGQLLANEILPDQH
jgi:pimeloyl-ACP methyl ester carboxylesterase